MAEAEKNKVIVELTHHTLHAMRVVDGTIEAGGECILENKASLEALLDSVAPDWKKSVVKSSAMVWPDGSAWHLSTDTEAMLDRTPAAMRSIGFEIQDGYRGALAYASCGAADGTAVTSDGLDKWVLSSTSADSLSKVTALLGELKFVSDGVGTAAFSRILAIQGTLRAAGSGSVALWDLGAEDSYLILVTEKGVEAVTKCEVGLDQIFQAIQLTLRLKFRGAGERLFFNETYDFSEPGPKVAAAIGPKLKEALGALVPSGTPPQLTCIGLTGKQAWFFKDVSAAAGTTPWEPDVANLAEAMGMKFADPAVAAGFTSSTIGLIAYAGALAESFDSWMPAWVAAEAIEEEAPASLPPMPVPEPTPEPAPRPAPRAKPTISKEPDAAPAPAPAPPKPEKPAVSLKPPGAPPSPGVTFKPPVPAPSAPAAAPAPAAPKMALAPRPGQRAPSAEIDDRPPSFSRPGFVYHEPDDAPPAPPAGVPSAPAPAGAVPPLPLPGGAPPPMPLPAAAAAPAPIPGPPGAPPLPMPGAPPAPGGFPPPPTAKFAIPGQPAAPGSVTALPFEAVKLKGATQAPFSPTQAPFTQAPFEEPPKSRASVFIGIGVAGAVVFAAIAVLVNAHLEKIKAKDEADAAALALQVNQARLVEAQKAADEEKAQHEKDLQMAVEITRQQTEEETRRKVLEEQEEDRISKLPGTLVADTSPSGASISIDGAMAMNTPIKLDGVPPGTHKILITKPGFENVEMTVELKGSKTKDLGTITLETSLGSVDISSTPDSLDYAIRPASQSLGKPVRTGKTPATIDDLPHGDYIVTISRPGCRDHVSKLTIEKGGHSAVDTKYLDGSLELTSDPSGAWVAKDGSTIGSTPLSLHDLTPKTAHFELTLPGYDTTPVTCEIPEGQTLKLNAELLRKDRVFKPTEVKTGPIPTVSPQPVLSSDQRKLGGDILLSLIVRRDGSVSDVVVEKATDDDIGRRCQAAVENWKYRPATADDDRTVDAQIEVPFKFTPQN